MSLNSPLTSDARILNAGIQLVELLVPSRGPQSVAPVLVPYVDSLWAAARRLGATFLVTSGHRTAAQQADLYRRWLSGDPAVVYPPAKNSYHEYGLAVDIESNELELLGRFAETLGMRWGGRYGDPVHFDLGRRS